MSMADEPWEKIAEIPTKLRQGATGIVVRVATPSSTLSFPLKRSQETTIGRGVDADIRVPSPDISRLHASLRLVDGVLSIRELGSSNGTFVRGQALTKGDWTTIAMREPVLLGDALLVVLEGGAGDVASRVVGEDAFGKALEAHLATYERLGEPFGVCTIEVQAESAWSDLVVALLAKNDVAGFVSETTMWGLLANRAQPQLEIFRSVVEQALAGFSMNRKISLRICPRDGTTMRALCPAKRAPARDVAARVTRRPPPPAAFGTAMRKLHELIDDVAPTSTSILIGGETGVGKDVLARAIHQKSDRSSARIVSLNCAALPETLLESELFGYERGAFTGAVAPKPGLLESAEGGTVFLDEVGELPLAIQAKLLRVLEDRTVVRLGGLKSKKVDFRLLAATNKNLQTEIAAGRFRADLFYRINGLSVTIPPLRERREEIVPFALYFTEHAATKLGKSVPTFSPAALAALESYDWPGNIRELRNAIERAVLLARGGAILPDNLPEEVLSVPARAEQGDHDLPSVIDFDDGDDDDDDARPPPTTTAPAVASSAATARNPRFTPPATADERPSLRDELERLEYERIVTTLEQYGGNQTRAAKALGITRRVLIGRVERFGLPRPRKSND